MSALIDVAGVQASLDAGHPLRILDVRWRLDEPFGRPAYVRGHLPGAVFVDLDEDLSDRGRPEEGRHPVPATTQLQQAARRWGVNDGDVVIVYDDNDSVAASRAWWLLRGRGVDVRVLDGGFRAWIAAGGLLDSGDVLPQPGTVTLGDGPVDAAGVREVASAPRDGVLIDVRSPQHYRGSVAGLDPRAGHIPGAVNVPTLAHIAPDGRFRSPADIAATLRAAGVSPTDPVVVYCSSGIASATPSWRIRSSVWKRRCIRGRGASGLANAAGPWRSARARRTRSSVGEGRVGSVRHVVG